MKNAILLIFFLAFGILDAAPKYLLVNGTWTKPFSWHMPGGEFFEALTFVVDEQDISFFHWSGINSPEARKKAADDLTFYIESFYKPHDELIIIAHSHGGNVATLASQILGKKPENKHRIHKLFTLGMPIELTGTYAPDMNVINYIYNLFSWNDFVQPIMGLFGREFPSHERIANLAVCVNNHEPDHSELHQTLIALWIPQIHEKLAKIRRTGFDQFDFLKPGIIYFDEDSFPCYVIDTERKAHLERDQFILAHMQNMLQYAHGRLGK